MLNNMDIQLNTTINQWIVGILLFSFTMVHIPGEHIAANGMFRHTPQPDDTPDPEEDFKDWIDHANSFMPPAICRLQKLIASRGRRCAVVMQALLRSRSYTASSSRIVAVKMVADVAMLQKDFCQPRAEQPT